MFERVGPEHHIEQRWRNGGGSTVEVAREPAAGDFIWRLSMATVRQSGTFSVFPHVDRILLLLDGAGLGLDFGPHGRVRVDRLHAPIRFAGDWTTDCTLLAGPVRDLNLMVDRRRACAEARVLDTDESRAAAAITLLYTLHGEWRVSVEGCSSTESLSGSELLVVREQTGRKLSLAGAGRVLWADLTLLEER